MARRARGGMQFFADFSGVEKWLGNALGAFDAMENKSYQEDLVMAAFVQANEEFNREAAAYAAAGGNIKHMFEWGTTGINRGRTNMRPNPLSERARLWTPYMEGSGLRQQFDFRFKPSVAFVPKPTATETGMDPSVIADMRDHVFYNKAMVMESGMQVVVRLKEAQFLLFPFYKGRVPANARSNDIARGYTLHKGPVVLRPGARTAGQFNTYWVNFWNNRGNEYLNLEVQKYLEEDFRFNEAKIRSGMVTKPMPGAVAQAVKRERARVARNARRRAAYRRKKEQNNG